ncbi:MAG: hypothetical protein LBS59_08615 [Puniceicoccales bacterium]|jgi:hypothetical protein|nr:hypothetical protein [Puniceicoccales bacterium]
MKSFRIAALAVVFGVGLQALPASGNSEKVPIPPHKVPTVAPAGDWKAAEPAAALEFNEVAKRAREAEEAGDAAAALTAWERVLDRTSCTEEARSAVRARIKELRPKVQINRDPAKARKWSVLALIYGEVDFEKKDANGNTRRYRQVFSDRDVKQVGRMLAGFRDLVFEWSSGIVLLEIDAVLVKEPLRHLSGRNGYYADIRDAAPEVRKAQEKKHYDTVISYVKYHGGPGASIPRPPFAGATYGRVGQFKGAGYIMIPWTPSYPFKGEFWGEVELHEWLHQIDDVLSVNLGYPRGTFRSPDDGRGEGDNRPNGETEYRKPRNVRTWVYFYRHLMQEHMTRQMWNEVTIKGNLPQKPGSVIRILGK